MSDYRPPPLPAKCHGGKGAHGGKLAQWLISLMVPHRVYTEAFAGGLAVLLYKDPDDPRLQWADTASDRGCVEIVNDLNGRWSEFWQVARDPADVERLSWLWERTEFNEKLWKQAMAWPPGPDRVQNAWQWAVAVRMSLAGRMTNFATISTGRTRRGRCEQASAWDTAGKGLRLVYERMRRVVVLDAQSGLRVIAKYDCPEALHYVDPPYLGTTRTSPRAYKQFEMGPAEHQQLLALLATIRGKVVLSGYADPMYDGFAAAHGWEVRDFQTPNHAAGGRKKRVMTERAWMNYTPPV